MKTISNTKMICIHEDNAKSYEAEFNRRLEGIDKPIIEIDKTVPFLCYVTYKETKTIPETKLEELEENFGRSCHCIECPHFEKGPDKRRKIWYCNYHNRACIQDERCCERFYEEKGNDETY